VLAVLAMALEQAGLVEQSVLLVALVLPQVMLLLTRLVLVLL